MFIFFPMRKAIQLLNAAAGLRESPTSLIVFSGPLQSVTPLLPLTAALSQVGFHIFSCDLLRPQFSLCTSTVDEIVDKIHASVQEARICSPPVALTFGLESILLQKYLESYPLAGLVMVDPLPPSPQQALHGLLRASGGTQRLPKSAACDTAQPATAALAAALAPEARTQVAATMAASLLLRLAKEPVNLEPSPVPLLLLGDELRGPGVAATAALHGIPLPVQPMSSQAIQAWIEQRF